MALAISQLDIQRFRGYSHLRLEDLSHLNVVCGPNAVGKTNIIEAIQLLTSATSFRKPSWAEIVSWGQEDACLTARFTDGKRLLEHRLRIQDGERLYEVNGKKKGTVSVRGACPCVLFIPDDLQMVKASSAARRDAVDGIGVQLSKEYSALRADYRRVLRQRNLLLRDGVADPALLGSWNESLAVNGARLHVNRMRLFTRIASHMKNIYAQLVEGESLDVVYIPSWERFEESGAQKGDSPQLVEFDERDLTVEACAERIVDSLERLADTELRRKTTLAGPHKDEVAFFIAGRNARLFASQGQQRTVVLCWKLAEVEVVSEILEQEPVLLLDDVMSELDEAHRNALTGFVEKSAQTFITTANPGYFSEELLSRAKVIDVPIPNTRYDYR